MFAGPLLCKNLTHLPGLTDDLARLRRAPGDGDENEVDGMDYFGLRVCVYNAGECRLQYGMVDDADDRSVHIMYDDEAEGWLNLPNKQVCGISMPLLLFHSSVQREYLVHARDFMPEVQFCVSRS